jgi:hypothetical protein
MGWLFWRDLCYRDFRAGHRVLGLGWRLTYQLRWQQLLEAPRHRFYVVLAVPELHRRPREHEFEEMGFQVWGAYCKRRRVKFVLDRCFSFVCGERQLRNVKRIGCSNHAYGFVMQAQFPSARHEVAIPKGSKARVPLYVRKR